LWYIVNGEMKTIKPNKQSIGKTDDPLPFTTHEIENAKGIILYLFTDGIAVQFGAEKGKKFKYKKLETILMNSYHLPFSQQYEILSNEFKNWKGNLEQVDDVCVIGVK